MIIKSLPILGRMAFFGGRDAIKVCNGPFAVGECVTFTAESEMFDVRLSTFWTFVLDYAVFTGIVVSGQNVRSDKPAEIFREAVPIEGYVHIRLNKGWIRVQ